MTQPSYAGAAVPGLTAAEDGPRLPSHESLPEPVLCFHPDRAGDRHVHPLVGLTTFGPYSRSVLGRVLDPIRVAVIAPHGALGVVDALLHELEAAHEPTERKNYLVSYRGFSRIFGVRLAASAVRLTLSPTLDRDVEAASAPHLVLADHLTRAVQEAASRRADFDVLVIYLPTRWSCGFWGPDGDDFDLHDYLKSRTALQAVPMQIVREDSALTYPHRCSVAWRLGIALYCKAGGVPWKLASADPGVAYIGLSYAVRAAGGVGRGRHGRDGGRRRGPGAATGGRKPYVTCCSQVFDADGTGIEFIAYPPDPGDFEMEEGDNPFLTRSAMRRIMARSMALYQRRHAGEQPRRIVVHKTTGFTADEVEGCFDVLRAANGVDLVQVQQDSPWRGVLIERPRAQGGLVAGGYPVLRGTFLPLGPREVLVWTQGDAPEAVGGGHYYKEGKGIPAPLLLRRFAGHGGWDDTAAAVLGLSKMNWNSDYLYDRLPATLGFAGTLARVLGRIDAVGNRTFAYRLFM